jgi:hypothetical protein
MQYHVSFSVIRFIFTPLFFFLINIKSIFKIQKKNYGCVNVFLNEYINRIFH